MEPGVMGVQQSQVSPIDSDSSSSGDTSPDGPAGLALQTSTLEERRRLKSLDRSLKAFLRASNLPGLEYRLRLGGFYSVDDLIGVDMTLLGQRGFTALMAKRLINALDEYISRHLEGPRLPFQVVRQGQKMKLDPTDSMRSMPTFGKQNVKRRKALQEMAHKSAKTTKPAVKPPKPAVVHAPPKIRLMSNEMLKTERYVLPLSPEPIPAHVPAAPPANQGRHTPTTKIVDYNVRYAANMSHFNSAAAFPAEPLRRTASVPGDFQWYGGQINETDPFYWQLHHHIRHYSCPASLVSTTTQPLETLLSSVESGMDANTVFTALQQLVLRCKRSPSYRAKVLEAGGVGAATSALQRMNEYPEMVAEGCRLLKLLTRRASAEDSHVHPEAMSAVLLAMDSHPSNMKVQRQACLAMGNIGRADPSQCRGVLFNGGVQSVSTAMAGFDSSPTIQVAAMAALSVALANVPDGRSSVLSDHGFILDHVITAMVSFIHDPRVQQYACAVFALLVAEVSEEVENEVMQLMVEHTAVAMGTHSHDLHVTIWGCKLLAHAASNAILGEWKLAARCCELLSEAMRTFPESSELQTWAAFALYQLAMCHKTGVLGLLARSNVPGLCDHPHPSLGSEAQYYLYLLGELISNQGRLLAELVSRQVGASRSGDLW